MIKKLFFTILFTLVLSGGAYAIFADPLEKCMNRVIKGTYDNDEFFAAKQLMLVIELTMLLKSVWIELLKEHTIMMSSLH